MPHRPDARKTARHLWHGGDVGKLLLHLPINNIYLLMVCLPACNFLDQAKPKALGRDSTTFLLSSLWSVVVVMLQVLVLVPRVGCPTVCRYRVTLCLMFKQMRTRRNLTDSVGRGFPTYSSGLSRSPK